MARVSRQEAEALYLQHIRAGNEQAAKAVSDSLGYIPKVPVGDGEAAFRGFGQGATFGYQDEMSAALSAGAQSLFNDANYDDAYAAAIKRMREDNRLAAENPFYTAGEIVGGVVAPGGAVGAGLKGASAAGRVLRAGVAGAGQGALAATGYSERQDIERLNDAGIPAAVGGALGAGLPMVGPRLLDGLGRLKNAAFDTPMRGAERAIGREMGSFNTVDEVRGALDALGPQGMLADLAPGAGVQAVSKAGDSIPGGSLPDALARRQAGAPGRVRGIMEDATGSKVDDYAGRVEDLQGRAATAGTAYEAIRNQAIPRELIDDIIEINSPLMVQAVRNARAAMAEEGRDVVLNDAYAVPLAFLDKVKQHLDAVAASGGGPGSGVNGAQARRAADLAAKLRGRMDEIVPEYANTRGAYAEVMGELEALGASASNSMKNPGGRQVFRIGEPGVLDDVADRVSNMTPAQAENFRLGAAQGADDVITRRARAGSNVATIFNADVPDSMGSRVLDIIVPDSIAANRARQALEAERQMHNTFTRVTPNVGAKTQGNIAANTRGDLSVMNMVKEAVLPGGLTRETAQAMQALLQRGDLSEAQLRRIVKESARMGLLEANPEQMELWLKLATATTRVGVGLMEE
jgi:hypothetical protein